MLIVSNEVQELTLILTAKCLSHDAIIHYYSSQLKVKRIFEQHIIFYYNGTMN